MSADQQPQSLAEGSVRFVQEATGLTLDYTQDTLPILDHYLQTIPATSHDEVLGLIVPVCGSYFGEVIRRRFHDSRWFAPTGEHNRWRIEFSHCFFHFNPLGMVLEAIEQGSAPGWNAHLTMLDQDRSAVEAALTALGQIEEHDYYRLSVRYEAIEVAHNALMARSKPGQTLGHDTYEAATKMSAS